MAKFDEEFNKVILAEGGYVNDPDDAGGEVGVASITSPRVALAC